MAVNKDLRFSNNNLLPVPSETNWVLNNAVINTDGQIVIQPGGSISVKPEQTIVNLTFMYTKLIVKFSGDSISPANNFKTGPMIKIRETYKNNENAIYLNKTRGIGFNTFNEIDSTLKIYEDTTILQTLNKPIASYYFSIVNNGESALTIYNVGIYTSIDIAADQVSNIINTVNSSTDPNGFKVYTDPTYSWLNGLSVTMANSDAEIKYKPIYSGGLLSSIETNFGVSYSTVYVPEPIDLDS